MAPSWRVRVLCKLLLLATLPISRALQFTYPGFAEDEPPTIFNNESLNVTWSITSNDPTEFKLNSLCKNVVLTPLRTVNAADLGAPIPATDIPPDSGGDSQISCVLQATYTSNDTQLATSGHFVVSSSMKPVEPQEPESTSQTASTTSLTVTISRTTTVPPASTIAEHQSFLTAATSAEATSDDVETSTTATSQITNLHSAERTDTTTLSLSLTSTSVVVSFTTVPPTQTEPVSRVHVKQTPVGAIAGGTVGGFLLLTFLFALALIICRRRRHRTPPGSPVSPLLYSEGYTQPPESKLARSPGSSEVVNTPMTFAPAPASAEARNAPRPLSMETDTLVYDESEPRLRQQVHQMSQRIMELEDEQQRELEIYAGQSGPPSYAHPETIMAREPIPIITSQAASSMAKYHDS